MSDIRQQIEASLAVFGKDDLKTASIGLLNTLGYQSEKTLDLDNTPDAFLSEFDKRDRKLRQDKALFARWKSIDLLFQVTDDEVRNAGAQGTLDFDSGYAQGNYQSYLFFALDLEKNHYTRTQLADITREINLLFDMPAMLLMRHDGALTFAVIDRRLNKKDQDRDVLEKVKLIKDIRCHDPHRAHIEILHDLALPSLMAKHECRDFKQLHEAWRKTLDTNELNKKFYRELADWYFWALDHVDFPADVERDVSTRNATNVIRLLTRLIFCWFLKEKGLIPDALFSARHLAGVLKSMKDDDCTYYRAILQNLFFGTLNQRMNTGGQENRKFANDGSFQEQKDEYGVKNLYRYQKLFAVPEEEAIKLFADVPFLNGGLFDCLDKEDDSSKNKVVYVDGFTRNARKQPKVPNFLFFSDYRTLDLSDAFGDKKRKKEKVRGLISLLDSYKFTITENTPIEEEIALDPELLGKVFENLLASYNPETGTTARKQTGSFYTPREIVNYMVDESLIAYLAGKLTTDDTDSTDEKKVTTKHAKGAKAGGTTSVSSAEDRLRTLFAYTEKEHAFSDGEVDALIEAIDTCKILDPACGSGAFPMGILHKLVFILGKLDPHNERWKRKQIERAEQIPDVSARETATNAIEKDFETNDLDYGRKLYLIENCIYGVDIQPIAIQISKLRFFISLVCDQLTNKNKAQNCGVRPLPNLETKFVAANTLISLDTTDASTRTHDGLEQSFLLDDGLSQIEQQLAAVRHKHFASQRRRDKLALQKRDAELREQIAALLSDGGMSGEASRQLAAWDPYDQNSGAAFFDPEWMYGITSGFHVVIGNPPYVRLQTLKQQDPEQVALFKDRYEAAKKGNYDLYVVFVECGLNMLSPDGQLAFILPHKFFNAQYGKPLRGLLSSGQSLRHVVHFGDQQIFPGATNYVCLLFLAKAGADECRFVKVDDIDEWLAEPCGSEGAIPAKRIEASEWNFVVGRGAKLFEKLQQMPCALADIADRIFQGLVTGADPVFILSNTEDGLFASAATQRVHDIEVELMHPLCKGSIDLRRYCIEKPARSILFPYKLVDGHAVLIPTTEFRKNYPNAWLYLVANRKLLEARERGKWKHDRWYAFGRSQNLAEMEQSKILTPSIAASASFTLDESDYYYFVGSGGGGGGGYGVTLKRNIDLDLRYVVGLLNSHVVDWFLKRTASPFSGGYYAYNRQFIERLPIHPIDVSDKTEKAEYNAIVKLVEQIMAAKKDDPNADTTACEREIDERVYQLYGLTKAEIAIVEGQRE